MGYIPVGTKTKYYIPMVKARGQGTWPKQRSKPRTKKRIQTSKKKNT